MHRVSRLGDVAVIHLAMARRVPQNAIRASEQRTRSLLLTLHRRWVDERAPGTERPVHEVDSDDLGPEAAQSTDSHLHRLHRREHSLLVLADKELGTGLRLREGVNATLKRLCGVERLRAVGDNLPSGPSHEDGSVGRLPGGSSDQCSRPKPSKRFSHGLQGLAGVLLLRPEHVVVLVPLLRRDEVGQDR